MKRIYTKPITFGGPINEGSPYYNFKNDIMKEFQSLSWRGKGDISLEINLYLAKDRIKPGKNDLDNFLKPIIDALDEIKVIEETQIDCIKIKRVKVDKAEEEGVDIGIK
ncbi:MAG: RusA family crossover junction endodeoxyribonuclease [Candidatus Omnitrophica bacterium]|nr:RusA family crossover junction endodeoxyribonuclease [Candidatus Omnitrophota bacterium]